MRRDGLDFGAEFMLDSVEVEAVLVSNEIDSEAEMSEPTGTTDAMEISLRVLGHVEIYYDVYT